MCVCDYFIYFNLILLSRSGFLYIWLSEAKKRLINKIEPKYFIIELGLSCLQFKLITQGNTMPPLEVPSSPSHPPSLVITSI